MCADAFTQRADEKKPLDRAAFLTYSGRYGVSAYGEPAISNTRRMNAFQEAGRVRDGAVRWFGVAGQVIMAAPVGRR
jgi:hypothetical protein